MFRNQYDNDVMTWSPQGRIYQVEYAMEAVKQGSACVGVKNDTHAVIVALKRAPSDLSSFQPKVFELDSHCCIGISGLSSDARSLAKYMRASCMEHQWAYDENIPLFQLVDRVGNKLQRTTQFYSRRPFGVGLLVAGYDKTGPHIYSIDPSANYFDCKGMAIGARSQSAKTYLERHLDDIKSSDREGLVRHALLALGECLPSETTLTTKNTSVAIVGKDEPLSIANDDDVASWLNTGDAAAPEPAAAMDFDV